MTKRVALYARVSSDRQTVENQLRELRAVAERNKWEIVEEFTDEGVSGSRGRDKRPAFDALCKGIARRDFDAVCAWSVDRLGRSLQHLVMFLEELRAKDVGLYLHKQGLDTATPAGRMLFQMIGVFAEFERAIITERIMAGLARSTKRSGRPPVPRETVAAVLAARGNGMTVREIAASLNVARSTVGNIVSGRMPPRRDVVSQPAARQAA